MKWGHNHGSQLHIIHVENLVRVCVITRVTYNDSSHLSWLESLVDSSQHAVESESSQSHFTGDSSQVSHLGEISSRQVKSKLYPSSYPGSQTKINPA